MPVRGGTNGAAGATGTAGLAAPAGSAVGSDSHGDGRSGPLSVVAVNAPATACDRPGAASGGGPRSTRTTWPGPGCVGSPSGMPKPKFETYRLPSGPNVIAVGNTSPE